MNKYLEKVAEKIKGGKADGIPSSVFDKNQIEKGVKVELEHTADKKKALEIVKDHLTELPDYYDRLQKMESKGKKELGLKKDAGLSLAAAAHMGQSMVTNRLTRNKDFARSIANHAGAGLLGREVPKKTGREMAKGLISPEAAILQRESHHLGSKLRDALEERGIDAAKLTKKELVELRKLTRGDFSKVLTDERMDSPIVRAVVQTIEESGSIPKGPLTAIIRIKDPEKRRAAILELEEVWKDKTNPITSNIMTNITRPNKDILSFQKGHGRDSTLEMMAANIPAAAADPITAFINAGKTYLASDSAAKVPAVAAAKKKVVEKIVSGPAQKSYERGLQGLGLPLGGVPNQLMTVAVNPVAGQSSKLGNELGKLIRKYTTES